MDQDSDGAVREGRGAGSGSGDMVWYRRDAAPVQIELGSSDISRQISQQLVQYTVNQQGQIIMHQTLQPEHPVQQPDLPPPSVIESSALQSNAAAVPQAQPNQVLLEYKPRKSGSGTAPERVTCPLCNKTFSCPANMKDHMRLHTGEKPFKCGECGMCFSQRSNWRLHKRVHTGEKPYMCGICGRTFARSSHLPGHMRIHTGEKPFNCSHCGTRFASTQALKNHVRIHTGEKPYVCSACNTAFSHSSSLSAHKRGCNGTKRKRGRPVGTGRKVSSKKPPTGRPRGRPKKKNRLGRGRKKRSDLPSGEQQVLGLPSTEFMSIDEAEQNGTASLLISEIESLSEAPSITHELVNIKKESTTSTSANLKTHKMESSKVTVRESARLRLKQLKKKESMNLEQSESELVGTEVNLDSEAVVTSCDSSPSSIVTSTVDSIVSNVPNINENPCSIASSVMPLTSLNSALPYVTFCVPSDNSSHIISPLSTVNNSLPDAPSVSLGNVMAPPLIARENITDDVVLKSDLAPTINSMQHGALNLAQHSGTSTHDYNSVPLNQTSKPVLYAYTTVNPPLNSFAPQGIIFQSQPDGNIPIAHANSMIRLPASKDIPHPENKSINQQFGYRPTAINILPSVSKPWQGSVNISDAGSVEQRPEAIFAQSRGQGVSVTVWPGAEPGAL